MIVFDFLVVCTIGAQLTECFIPNKFVDSLAWRLNRELNLDEASATLTHGEITKRGIIKSIAKYLYDEEARQNDAVGAPRIRLERMSFYWSDVRHLYNDFYSRWISQLEIDKLIETTFRINVAMVDFDQRLKDLPQAHFDANKFLESNERIIDHSRSIIIAILRKDYATARQLFVNILNFF